MAGRSRHPRWTLGRDLTTAYGRGRLACSAATLGLGGCLVLTGCVPRAAAPTPDLVPTLIVVTATPGPPAAPTPGVEQRYQVREGDTLSAIAARFGVAEDAILDANGITDPDRILVGQDLIIPPAQP